MPGTIYDFRGNQRDSVLPTAALALSGLAKAIIGAPDDAARGALLRSQRSNLDAEGIKTGLETDLLRTRKKGFDAIPGAVNYTPGADGVPVLDMSKMGPLATALLQAGMGSGSINDVQKAGGEDAMARRDSTLRVAEENAKPRTLSQLQGETYAKLPAGQKLADLFPPVIQPAGTTPRMATDETGRSVDPRFREPAPAPTPTTAFSKGKSAGGPDEMQDTNTNNGVSATGKNLTPGIAAVNPQTYPLGTVFRDHDTGEFFIAGDVHGNSDPNVIDIYTNPDRKSYYDEKAKAGSRHLEAVGSVKAVGKTPEQVQAQLAHIKDEWEKTQPEAAPSLAQSVTGALPAAPAASTATPGATNAFTTPPRPDRTVSVRSQSFQKAVGATQSAIAQVDAALQAVDANPNAFGLQNAVGQTVRQRLPGFMGGSTAEGDPNGATLANVMGLAALKRHSLYGGALTPTETNLSHEFIPSSTDKPEVVKEKLLAIKKQYELDLEGLQGGLQKVSAMEQQGINPDTVAPEIAAPKTADTVHTISSEAEYNALPSGAVYVGPDGNKRQKR